jgi:predicted transcriptional regulator
MVDVKMTKLRNRRQTFIFVRKGESNMKKQLLELAVGIVQAQASSSTTSPEDIEVALMRTFNALHKMQKAELEQKPVALTIGPEDGAAEKHELQKIGAKESIQETKVICLECGAEFKQLTANHLRNHALTSREYKRKWGFPLRQSLTAKSMAKARSRAAKKRGLPENLIKYRAAQKLKKMGMEAPQNAPPAAVTEKRKQTKAPAKKPRAKKAS